jgi:hypothetical protein
MSQAYLNIPQRGAIAKWMRVSRSAQENCCQPKAWDAFEIWSFLVFGVWNFS